ncbi:MAG: hypothetical protein JWO32_1040 [Bacteroidetes bacterium]|nr:hypothetical protein [Bacteroidota bacterium]
MKVFELPLHDGKPIDIMDYKVDLLVSPPLIEERIIDTVDNYIDTQTQPLKIEYKDAPTDEGRLNIYICRFRTGKYRLHIFGKIRGQEFRTEKEVVDGNFSQNDILKQRIKYVLKSSRNILRTYYLNSNLKSMEDHLIAFLIPA